MSTISAVAVLCVTQQGCGHGLISCFPVVWISLLSLEIPLSAKIFMCRDNSCVISSHNLHDILPFLTGKVMISITHHWLWYSQMLINFEIVISERGRGVISLKRMVFVAQVFKRLKFDCQFKWFLCAAPWKAISCFLSVKFGSSVILLHGTRRWWFDSHI